MPKRKINKVAKKSVKKAIANLKKRKKGKSVSGTSKSPSIRKHLEALGESALIDLVLELAKKHDAVKSELVNRFSTTDERFVRLEKSIRYFSSSSNEYGYDYYGDTGTEDEVLELIKGINALDDKPEVALELLALLFEKDEEVMENANQYEDSIGEVFTNDATDLFGKLVRKIENKKLVEDILFRLLPRDDYGTRMDLIKHTHFYLPKASLKNLIERFVAMRSKTSLGTYGHLSLRVLLKDLLSQCKDPAYFESTLLEFDGKENSELCFEVARSWFEAKNYLKAHDWLQKIQKMDVNLKSECLEMLRVIHAKRKDKSALADTNREIFARKRNKENFQNLLKVIGNAKRESVLAEAIKEIEKQKDISCDNVDFLVSVGAVDTAEDYLWRRLSSFSRLYGYQPNTLARMMQKAKRPLIATALFRSMVETILNAAKSKDYPTAIAYMNELHKLAQQIKDWKKLKPHKEYVAALKEQYPKRPSFWPKVK